MKKYRFILLGILLLMVISLSFSALASESTLPMQSSTPVISATTAPQPTGSLIITSAFSAPEGFNPNKVFTFVVRDSLGQVVASPTIVGQGSVTVTGLTIGESYTVTEEFPCEKGYGYKIEVSGAADKNGGVIRVGGLPQRVDFLTSYVSGKPASAPKTGDDNTLPILYSLAAITGIGGIYLFASGKRKEQMY
ncbi:MAG: hypothetical protein ACOX58_03800 [Christensenellales bacterium]|jgi:hypothetical protein